jgi:hypothetical protein
MIPDTTREAFIEVLSYLYSGSISLTLDTLQVRARTHALVLARLHVQSKRHTQWSESERERARALIPPN